MDPKLLELEKERATFSLRTQGIEEHLRGKKTEHSKLAGVIETSLAKYRKMFGRVGHAGKAMISKVWQGARVLQKRQNHADDFDELVLLSPKVNLQDCHN